MSAAPVVDPVSGRYGRASAQLPFTQLLAVTRGQKCLQEPASASNRACSAASLAATAAACRLATGIPHPNGHQDITTAHSDEATQLRRCETYSKSSFPSSHPRRK